jgi:hypothetical protein
MKVYAIISVARQVDGEYCVVKVEKAFDNQNRASEFGKSLALRYAETITTPSGVMKCVCERGIFEIEVETQGDNS